MAASSAYDILDSLRDRPGMYLGDRYERNQFDLFQAFLTGLSLAELDGGNPSFWGFSRWVTGYVDGMSASCPWGWLEARRGQEQSFKDFFLYLDVYRACRIIEIATLTTTDLMPAFYSLDSERRRIAPPIPDSIHIGQFAPSEVFFLGERYGDRLEMHFPYHGSLSDAIDDAHGRWQVPADRWKLA